jgi:hypothetical protein
MSRRSRPAPDPSTGVYAISVAADLAGMDPQSLRAPTAEPAATARTMWTGSTASRTYSTTA